jgi:hypothetical protein
MDWIGPAIGATVVVVPAIVGLIYRTGRQAQRMDTLEAEVAKLRLAV